MQRLHGNEQAAGMVISGKAAMTLAVTLILVTAWNSCIITRSLFRMRSIYHYEVQDANLDYIMTLLLVTNMKAILWVIIVMMDSGLSPK